MKTESVRIRLNATTYLKYESVARLNQMPLSPFLRVKLEESENTVAEINALKSAIDDLRLSRDVSGEEKRAAARNNRLRTQRRKRL